MRAEELFIIDVNDDDFMVSRQRLDVFIFRRCWGAVLEEDRML